MIHDNDIHIIPEDVADYLRVLRKRERKLLCKKKFIKIHFLETIGRLKLLQGRDNNLPCMTSSKNIYQLSTVSHVRDILVLMLRVTSEVFIRNYLELGVVQRRLNQDMQAIYGNHQYAPQHN